MYTKKKVVAIIQARMGSTRLPGKMMKDISGKPLVQHIIERVSYSKMIDDVIVATTLKQEDDIIIDLCSKIGTKGFRGSENDVLDRFYQCAKKFEADIIVRITGDCPFVDPDIIDMSINHFLNHDCDYASTAYPEPSFPDGLDVEVFSFKALEIAWKEAGLPSEREHVLPYIWKNELGQFKVETIRNDKDLSHKRWTIDDQNDLKFVVAIYDALHRNNSIFKFKDILDYLEKHPELEKINAGTIRNEGYIKSLKMDKEINKT